MPSLAYARDLSRYSRSYTTGLTCNGVPCTAIPNCDQAHACVSQCGQGVLQNCGSKGSSPFAGLLDSIGGGATNTGEKVAKGAGNISKGASDAWNSTLNALKSSLGALTAPCGWAMKVPGINQIPCWLTYMLIILGLFVAIKH